MCLAIARLLNTCSNGADCALWSSQTTSYPGSALTALAVCPVVLVAQMMTSQPRLTKRSKLDWILPPLSTPIFTSLILNTTLSSTLVLCSCSTLALGYFARSNSSTVLIVWLLPIFRLPFKANTFFKSFLPYILRVEMDGTRGRGRTCDLSLRRRGQHRWQSLTEILAYLKISRFTDNLALLRIVEFADTH